MEFREFSDDEWGFIRPLLPPKVRVGRLRADDRRIVNGILYVLTTGCRWSFSALFFACINLLRN